MKILSISRKNSILIESKGVIRTIQQSKVEKHFKTKLKIQKSKQNNIVKLYKGKQQSKQKKVKRGEKVMKQKSQQSQTQSEKNLHSAVFFMVFKVNQNRHFRKQANIFAYVISMVINALIFISSKQIDLVSRQALELNTTVVIVLFAIMGVIMFQFLLCLVYKVEFYLGVQFKLVRYIVFPGGIMYFFGDGRGLMIGLAVGLIIVVMGMTFVFEEESYSEKLLHQNLVPMSSYFIVIQILFYISQFTQTRTLTMVLACLMTMTSYLIKVNFYHHEFNDHFEHKLLSINSFLYCVYSTVILLSTLTDNPQTQATLIFIVPLIAYYLFSQLVKQKSVPITFQKLFTSKTLNFQQFILYAEYLVEQSEKFNKIVHSNFCDSLIFTFYCEHQRYCQKTYCKLFSDNWKEQFKNSSDPKTIKKLTQRVMRKIEMLFQEVHKNQPDNIEVKISFIKFYISPLPNKIRVLELISQLQTMNLTLILSYQMYKLKKLSDKMDNVEVIDNLKTDDEVNQFQRIAYLTINSMMEFWMHFTQEKIDLRKIMSTSQRLLNYKNQMQIQWQKNKKQEKYSTLKIALLYTHYLKNVLHDTQQADYLEFSTKALEQKLLHKKQIKYLSFGSESALIGASLTDETLGKIVIANNQASHVFGYSRDEINKIRLNDIMPKTYAEQHDHYLLQFQKNKYKRINSDERLVFGKDKHGFIIPIMLQLQRTISSLSEQLLFIANIKKCKVRQSPLICITDQDGEIIDLSSGFKEIFFEKRDKNRKNVSIASKNIQQIIPSFFENSQPEDSGNYKFLQKYYTQKYGEIPIQFTVNPISFPLKQNGGFIVMGNRQIQPQTLSLTSLNLTKEIESRMLSEQGFEWNRANYNKHKNRYEVESNKKFLHRKKNSRKDIFTIPFINIHDMANVFGYTKQETNLADKIRTVRLIKNGAFIRVQEDESFYSQEMSQTQKVNRFDFKLKQWKYQYLHNKSNLLFITIVRLFIVLIVLALGLIWIVQSSMLSDETADRTSLLKQSKFRFEVRGYLSEYILSFHGVESQFNGSYFVNKMETVKSRLVRVINEATSIEETQKEPILMIVYLQNQADLKRLITSTTLSFPISYSANISDIQDLWIGYMVIFSLLIICQIAIKCLHSQKIHGVYHVFLGVDQKLIRMSYQSCYKFSQMLNQSQGEKKKQHNRVQQFDQQNQNPVNRMKKYKQESKIDFLIYTKYFLTLVVIIFSCVIINVMMRADVLSFNDQIEIFNRVEGLFPESSIALMNAYFNSYRKQDFYINETFNETYQYMDQKILEYQTNNQGTFSQDFFYTLMDNACQSTAAALSLGDLPLCPLIQQRIFTTGVDKVTNYIAISISNINTNSQPHLLMDQKFFNLFQLQYDFYVPIVRNISSLIHDQMVGGVSTFQQKYKIWMGVVTLIIFINSFYIYQILLNQIKSEIQLVKELLYLIPDSFIEEKQTKTKKKPARKSSRNLKQSAKS